MFILSIPPTMRVFDFYDNSIAKKEWFVKRKKYNSRKAVLLRRAEETPLRVLYRQTLT